MSGSLPVQYSKIQIRRGLKAELPGIPNNGSNVPTTGLDIGEFGFTTDTGQLYIGLDPTSGVSQATRSNYPYDNIEVLTENSSNFLQTNFDFLFRDVQNGYFVSDALTQQSSNFNTFYNLTVGGNTVDIAINGDFGQAQIYYNLYMENNPQSYTAIKTGILKVTYQSGSLPPSMTDCGNWFQNFSYNGTDPNYAFGGFAFKAIYTNGGPVLLQYCNVTQYQPVVVKFRMERAIPPIPTID